MPRPSAPVEAVTARAPGKINLSLRVGELGSDGFHPLVSIFQAVSLYDDVTVTAADELSVQVTGPESDQVPVDGTNLAAQAVRAIAALVGRRPDVKVSIVKHIPVAGGMGGGSADAAAALVACDALWRTRLDRQSLLELAAGLGSDVPFALVGGTALGTGRGDLLTPALVRGQSHWVLALASRGLGTAEVYAQLDRLRTGHVVAAPRMDVPVTAALAAGDSGRLGTALVNDLEPASTSLRPELRRTLAAGREAGALGSVISGSGPTCAFLARDPEHALDLAVTLSASGCCRTVKRAVGPAPGAHLVS